MPTVNVQAAKATLSQLLTRVEAGEEIILTRRKKPIAKLVPFNPPAAHRRFGALRGIISVGPEFLDALPEDEIAAWE
jgi:prevent-host-death family protein